MIRIALHTAVRGGERCEWHGLHLAPADNLCRVDVQQLASASLNGALLPSDFTVIVLDPLTGTVVGDDSNRAPTPTPVVVPEAPGSSSCLFCNEWKLSHAVQFSCNLSLLY